ncbi:ras association domain-containing protein 8 [Sphaeramia orbicularis]|uniref:ras association domain-containing protein 8 n=1 Tax=Sphaeramia orbicularis TaxID=375764 RepID=UPI00117C2DF4|nr:ras association domain-containing protein 8-like [Sphaeramia orbicularis]
MEVKVYVDGIPRVVCGLTEDTTCQQVVIALAQALGQPGRYMLQEKFKDFERYMMPNECLLETLEKYGEQVKEVQLILIHNGPSVWDEMSRAKVGRYQPCPPLRRKDVVSKMRRSSGSLTLHRQSLPPLNCLKEETEQQKDVKRPKRKSLTLMEDAWEWLESLGKGKVYSTAGDKESTKKTDKRNRISLDVSLTVCKDNSGRSSKGKVRGQKTLSSELDHQTSCCLGSQTREKESKHSKKSHEIKAIDLSSSSTVQTEDEKNRLSKTITHQLSRLHDLHIQIAHVDQQIFELEERQKVRKAEEEAQQRVVEEELEQIKFWENELKAEEGYEQELQRQFLEMRAKAVDCKAKLEDYKCEIEGFGFHNAPQEDSETKSSPNTVSHVSTVSTLNFNQQQSHLHPDVNINRKLQPRVACSPPHALVPPSQIKERRPTGPTELREWWTRWSEGQSSKPQNKNKVLHRSELTIYLASTKV